MSEVLGQQKSRRGYQRLLSRQFSLKSSSSSSEKKEAGAAKSSTGGSKEAKAHPLLKIIDAKKFEKAATKPEFLRYLEYMKEGGSWDPALDRPSIYFK